MSPAAPDPAIVDDPARIDAAWMTAALRAAGHDVEVASLEREAVGTGQMAHNERFFLRYAGGPPGAGEPGGPPGVGEPGGPPATLVGKFPSPSETSRASGASGGYRNEVRFYLDLAPRLSIRVPHCYHGAVSDDSASFTLLLEDMAPARQGDQIEGATPEQVEAAIVELAGLHAPLWGSPELEGFDFLVSMLSDQSVPIVEAVTPIYLERYADRFPPEVVEVTQGFAKGVARWVAEPPADSRTLVHGDYRLDNLLFGKRADGGVASTAVDWQTVSIASAGRDLGFLLGTSFAPELRREHERRLLEAYREALAAQGVARSPEAIWEDYRHGSLQGVFITMLGSMAVLQTDRGDAMFQAMAERSAACVRDLDALSLIL